MYLSRIQLDRRNPGIRQCMRDCQDMHRSLMGLFNSSRKEAGVLYRVFPKTMQVYLLSEKEPQAKQNMSGIEISGIQNIASLENYFHAGASYNFDILTSPCKKVEPDGGGNSRRRFLDTTAERLEWLRRKGWQSGFEVLEAQEELQQAFYGKHNTEQGGKMFLSIVRFTGKLRIIDAEKFKAAWKDGIGSGRAYGLGMLLLRGTA